jgi:hypothetical protein
MDTMTGRHLKNLTDNTVVQISPARICIPAIVWHNDDGAGRFMQIFNKASASVTLGSTTPDLILQLGADATAVINLFNMVWDAFSYAVTTTATGSTGGTSSWVAIPIL